jgi:hypothetical protein
VPVLSFECRGGAGPIAHADRYKDPTRACSLSPTGTPCSVSHCVYLVWRCGEGGLHKGRCATIARPTPGAVRTNRLILLSHVVAGNTVRVRVFNRARA